MQLYCSFQKLIFKDEKTGLAFFTVIPIDSKIPLDKEFGNLFCKGIILDYYPENMPLLLEGEYINGNKPFFYVKKVKPAGKNDSATLSFIINSNFSGIGNAYSEKIINLSNGNIFDYCKHDYAYEQLKSLGLKEENVISFINRINEYSNMQELVFFISYYGGEYSKAKIIYEKYGKEAIEKIRENPYILQECGVNYFVIEALAKKNNINVLNETRIEALIKEAMKIIEANGNTRTTFQQIFNTCRFLEKRANQGYKTNNINILAHILRNKDKYYIKETEKGYYLYTRRMFKIEDKSAKHVIRLINNRISFPTNEASIEEIEKKKNIKYGDEQKKAFNLLKDSGIKILTGGPGTGKSTVIDGLIKYYKQMFPENSVALCSPTGAASKKLREITGDDSAKTIHKLLDVKPSFDNSYTYRDEYNQLSYDLVIADEFSMSDAELFMMLVSGMKDGALLLLVGDQNQLSSVGSGNVLHDLLQSDIVESVTLKKVYRQSKESSIISNSIKIKSGNYQLDYDRNFEIYTVSSEEAMINTTINMAYKYKRNKNVKIYSPVKNNKYLFSTFQLNNKIRDMKNNKPGNKFMIYNGVKFYINDPIIMNKNNYKKGYLNGDQGVIVDIIHGKNGDSKMYIQLDGYDDEIILKGSNLSEIDLAYALTIHKSQGSECDIAITLIPEKPKGMLERSLVYVASTRAREKNIFIVQNNALKDAILTDRRHLRNTGLLDQIKENKYNLMQDYLKG